MIRLVIDDIPSTDNRYKGRLNVHEYRQEKKRWLEIVHWTCIAQKVQKVTVPCKVRLTYHFRGQGRRDPDNYSGKFILDGLVSAGVLEDDSFRHIVLELRAEFGSLKARTVIEIEELENDHE